MFFQRIPKRQPKTKFFAFAFVFLLSNTVGLHKPTTLWYRNKNDDLYLFSILLWRWTRCSVSGRWVRRPRVCRTSTRTGRRPRCGPSTSATSAGVPTTTGKKHKRKHLFFSSRKNFLRADRKKIIQFLKNTAIFSKLLSYFFCGLVCVDHCFAYVARFCIFERCLNSNPECC